MDFRQRRETCNQETGSRWDLYSSWGICTIRISSSNRHSVYCWGHRKYPVSCNEGWSAYRFYHHQQGWWICNRQDFYQGSLVRFYFQLLQEIPCRSNLWGICGRRDCKSWRAWHRIFWKGWTGSNNRNRWQWYCKRRRIATWQVLSCRNSNHWRICFRQYTYRSRPFLCGSGHRGGICRNGCNQWKTEG